MGQSVVIHRFLPWASSGGWRGIAISGVLAAQFAVPLLALVASEAPTRGGFQMYSGLGGLGAEVVSVSGEVREVDLTAVTAQLRAELDWSARLPRYLCETVPDSSEVRMTQFATSGLREWSVQCSE